MSSLTRRDMLGGAVAAGAVVALSSPARADAPPPFQLNEIIDSGHHFFGAVSRGLAEVVQEAGRRWGLPNGYVLGQEASAAFVGGLRYGDGKLYTRNAGDERIYWQGPSVGFDAGADGDRTMMLVYSLPAVRAIFQRFGGIDGSAYFVGGFGVHRPRGRQRDRRAYPLRRRRSAGRQRQLSQIHPARDLEPFLIQAFATMSGV